MNAAETMTGPEAMAIVAGAVGSWITDESPDMVASLVGSLELADLRLVTVAAVRLAAAMLESEAEDTDADPEAPAAHAFFLFSRAASELTTD